MALEHSKGRQIGHLTEIPEADIERCLEGVATAFGQSWLENGTTSTIQSLWQRKDFLATNELVLLGYAINRIGSASPRNLRSWVNDIKSGDNNRRKGAVFELYGMSLFLSSAWAVTPTAVGFRGFDAVLAYSCDDAKIALSIKNYGSSAHEIMFREHATKINSIFKEKLSFGKAYSMTVRIVCKIYPQHCDWRILEDKFCSVVEDAKAGIRNVSQVGNWFISFHGCPAELQPYSSTLVSYQTSILVPFHKNESKNLLDKLDEAAANAEKHAGAISGSAVRAVLVRIPETIQFVTCQQWASQYIVDNDTGPIDIIMLYQPSVIDRGNLSQIHHGFSVASKPHFIQWMANRRLNIEFLIGVFDGNQSRLHLIDGEKIRDIEQMYFYQAGDFYTVVDFNPDGETRAELNSLASGVFRHSVLRIDGVEQGVMQGIFPPKKSLSLFS